MNKKKYEAPEAELLLVFSDEDIANGLSVTEPTKEDSESWGW